MTAQRIVNGKLTKIIEKTDAEGGSRKRLVIAAGVVILVGGLGFWLLRPDPLAEARQLRAQLFSQDEDLSPEDRRELGKKLRDEMKSLSPEQRRALMSEQQRERAKELEQFFSLSQQEQQQELDRRIDRMMTRAASGGPGGPGFGGPRGGPGGGPGGPGNPGQGQPGADGSGGPPPGFGGKGSPEKREERRQQMLDYTTPEFRAQMYEFRQMMKDRMAERGITPPAMGRKGP
jgi:hypothetical protein